MIITKLATTRERSEKKKAEIISPFLCLCQFRSQVSWGGGGGGEGDYMILSINFVTLSNVYIQLQCYIQAFKLLTLL